MRNILLVFLGLFFAYFAFSNRDRAIRVRWAFTMSLTWRRYVLGSKGACVARVSRQRSSELGISAEVDSLRAVILRVSRGCAVR